MDDQDIVVLGKISGLHGIKGWVKVFSDTKPRKGIVKYSHWLLRLQGEWTAVEVESGREQGKGIIAKLAEVDDRDQAAALLGTIIGVPRAALPKPEAGTYYWIDLVGCRVTNLQGDDFGTIRRMIETGANDVMVVKNDVERLLPWVMDHYVISVDLENKHVVVDWSLDY